MSEPGHSPGLTRRERIDRSRSRAWIVQIHYRWESGSGGRTLRDALVDTVATRVVSKRRLPYIRQVLDAMDEGLPEVDRAIERALDNWRLDRLSTLDRAILRLGTTEILFLEDIPPKVSIQEAIRLAEAYGGPESPRFVNGVLDALYKAEGVEAGG